MRICKFIVFIWLFVCPAIGAGQTFTYIDWETLKIDSVLRPYNKVIPLEEDYTSYNYNVLLEYPEYEKLTAEETQRLLQLLTNSLPSTPYVTTNVEVSRKKGFLDVSFLPIVFRDGHYQKMLSFKLTVKKSPKPVVRATNGATRQTSSRYAENSVLAQGRWVKIGITSDGVYRLTPDFLRQIGFNDPSRVKLYGYGGHVQDEVIDADNDFDDLEEVPLYRDEKGLLFYGNGLTKWTYTSGAAMAHRINNYARKACYFLTEGDAPLSILQAELPTTEPEVLVNSWYDATLYKKEEFAWYSSGRNLYENYNYANGNQRTYSLTTHDANVSGTLQIAFTAASSTPTTVTPTVNGTTLAAFTIGSLPEYTRAATGTSTYNIYLTGNTVDVTLTTTAGSDARLNYLKLVYERRFIMSQPYMTVAHNHTDVIKFLIDVNGRSNVVLWRLGRRGQPLVEIPSSNKEGNVWSYRVSNPASERYVAVDLDADYPTPEYVEDVANQNLHATEATDMVIIVPKSGKLTAQAQRLAEAHERIDGLRTIVVRADQIYNEFSSGTPDATAYRRFMKMLYDRAESEEDMPRYLLLFGAGVWDNRMYTSGLRSKNPDDYLLCYESENSVSETNSYVMEDYFGLLDDGEGNSLLTNKVDIGIGRFPVTTESEAGIMVDKTIAYMENKYAGAWKNTVCILGDDGDNNQHLEMAEEVASIIENEYPGMQVNRIYWDAYTREAGATGYTYPGAVSDIKRQMETGCLMMNYTGHGHARGLSHEFVLTLSEFNSFNSPRIPLWMTAACDVAPFDMNEDNIGETAVKHPTGSAVAFYGTARTVYAQQNVMMNRYFTRFVLGLNEYGQRNTLGDAVRLSKVNLVTPGGATDYTANKIHYVLLGDPALILGKPTLRVVVDSINGKKMDETADPAQFQAGSIAHISGHIEDGNGTHQTSFNGALTVTVYDSESLITCLNNSGADEAFTFTTRDKTLYNGRDSIRNGQFSLTFPVPLDIKYSSETGRMVFYAINNESTLEANGYNEHFVVGGTADDWETDNEGPQIAAYLNREGFIDGMTVNAEPYFVASLEDASGINTTGNGVGHNLELSIDNDPQQTYNLNSYFENDFGDYTRGTLAYSIPRMTNGKHTLRFKAWDVMNNSSEITLHFNVNGSLAPEIVDIFSTQNPATTSTTFVVQHDRPGTTADVKVEVIDLAGRVIWEYTESGTASDGICRIPWNLTTSGGGRLQTGVYLYRATVSTPDSKASSRTNKILVRCNK